MPQTMSATDYTILFRCPESPILDEQHCELDGSVFGLDYLSSPAGTMYFIKHEGGRLYERRSTMFGLPVHTYWLRRVVDESGNIDEENFEMLMEKLDGQDLVGIRPEVASQ